MIDYSKYLGIPFKRGGRDEKGLDCYGLTKLINEELGIATPEYSAPNEQSLIYQIYNSEKELFLKLEKPEANCYVVFSIKPNHIHIGMMIDEYKFIHVLEKKNVAIEELKHWFWRDKIIGYYKWNN